MSLRERKAAASRAAHTTEPGIGRLRARIVGFVKPDSFPKEQHFVPSVEAVRSEIADFQRSSGFSTADLVCVLIQAGYPDDPTALGRYSGLYNYDKPLVPLSRFPEATQAIIDKLNGRNPNRNLAKALTRSDDPKAHAALVEYVLIPFPEGKRTDPLNADVEFSVKGPIIEEMIESLMYRTPGTHPLGKDAIIKVFREIMPGGSLYEFIMAEGNPTRIRDLETVQWNLAYRLKKSKDTTLQNLATEYIESTQEDLS